jgi:hypothetical protein
MSTIHFTATTTSTPEQFEVPGVSRTVGPGDVISWGRLEGNCVGHEEVFSGV